MAKLMLVEDDNNLREIYEARLQAEGYTIVSARDGEEALVVAKAEKPDLIISDVMMPKISGFEMLDILRNTDGLKDVKVIMLTALGQSDDQQRADRLGADRYLVKSQVTLEDIVKVAHELLGDAGTAGPAASPEPPSPTTPTAPTAPAPPTTPEPSASPVAPADDSASPTVPQATAKAADPAPTTTTNDSVAQSTADEEAAVEAKIEDFVAGATQDAGAPGAPATTPSAAATAPSDDVPKVEAEVEAADDKLMAEAVEALEASVAEPPKKKELSSESAAAVTPAPAPTEAVAAVPVTNPPASVTEPVPTEAAPVKESKPMATNQIAGKKTIEPIPTAKKDINELVELEAAKEQATRAPTLPQPVIVTDEHGVEPPPAAQEPTKPQTPPIGTVAPTEEPPAQAATVTDPTKDTKVDPSSIAL